MAKDCDDMYELVCKDKFADIDKRFDKTDTKLDTIQKNTNHFSRRPSWAISIVITALTGMVVFLAQYIITH